MRGSYKAGLLFVMALICLTIFGGSNVLADGESIVAAPLNPEFLRYMSSRQMDMVTPLGYTEDGRALGLIPSPVNLEHLKGINVFQKVQPLDRLSPSYDLRTQGKLTPVRNQGACGSCWTFATYGSLESALLPDETDDFSENHLKNTHGFDWAHCAGGNGLMSTAYLARWSGPVNEADDPYNASSGTSPSGLSPRKHVQDVYIIPERGSSADNDNLKNAVLNYGAVYVTMGWYGSTSSFSPYWNNATHAYYYSGLDPSNHGVAIVGWNDDYPKTNFATIPPGDGAFIIRNSWGSGWGDAGYFYISYYDSKLATRDSYSFLSAEPTTNFGRVYQYDHLGWISSFGVGSTIGWFTNIFTAAASEQLSAVGFYAASPDSPYEIYIYQGVTAGSPRSGNLAATQTGSLQLPGYHTINLSSPVNLTSGEAFSIVVKLTTPGYTFPIPIEDAIGSYSSGATASPGQSFYSSNGSNWNDLTGWASTANVCLKGFTAGSSYLRVFITGPVNGEWRRTGTTTWRASGYTETGLIPGPHTVEFSIVPGWNTKTNETVTVQMGQTTQLQVSYTQNTTQYQVSAATGDPNGTVAGGGTFIHNALVTLTAVANHGYTFSHWTENGQVAAGARATYSFYATVSRTLVAHFRRPSLPGVLMLLLDE